MTALSQYQPLSLTPGDRPLSANSSRSGVNFDPLICFEPSILCHHCRARWKKGDRLSFYTELKRRNVFKVAIVYSAVAWLLLQVSDTLGPALHLPEWFVSAVAFLLILGFPVSIIFAWAFDLTPEGLKLETDAEPTAPTSGTVGQEFKLHRRCRRSCLH